jgi:hypothetical protein
MSETTKLDLAREEFLKAAVTFMRGRDKDQWDIDVEAEAFVPVSRSWGVYRDLLDGKKDNAPLDEYRWFCPYCGACRPKFAFQLVGEALMGIGAIQYFNIFCGVETCRKLLTVAMAGFMPEAQMIAAARAQMAGKKPGSA